MFPDTSFAGRNSDEIAPMRSSRQVTLGMRNSVLRPQGYNLLDKSCNAVRCLPWSFLNQNYRNHAPCNEIGNRILWVACHCNQSFKKRTSENTCTLDLGFRCIGIADAGFQKHEAVCLPDYLDIITEWTLFHISKWFSSMLPQNHDYG